MSNEELDRLWQIAMRQAIEDGEQFTRYHFAKLVAEHSASVEREACAKVADGYIGADPIAAAIRARGNT